MTQTSWSSQLSRAQGLIVTKIESKSNLCEACVLCKKHKLPQRMFAGKTSAPLELIHTDVCGNIAPISRNNKRYFFVTFKYDFTNFCAVYFKKNKLEVFSYSKEFEAFARICIGWKIQRIRCVNGEEYISNQFRVHYWKHGMTVFYTHEQNGFAEKLNRILTEKASHVMRQQAGKTSLAWSYHLRYLCHKSITCCEW